MCILRPFTSCSDSEWPASAAPWPRLRPWLKRRENTAWISPRLSMSYRELAHAAATAHLEASATGIARSISVRDARQNHEAWERIF